MEQKMDNCDAIDETIGRLKIIKNKLEDAHKRLERELRDCRNELCLKCGEYKTAHLGSCDGCRWRNAT